MKPRITLKLALLATAPLWAACVDSHPVASAIGPDAGIEDAAVPAPVGTLSPPAKHGPPGNCAEIGDFFVARSVPQPRGSELDLVLTPRPGRALSATHDYAHCIAGDGAAWRRDYEGSLLLLLVRPSADREASLAALAELLAKRPATEAIAVALYTDTVVSVDLPTRDRKRTLSRLRTALQATAEAVEVPRELPDEAVSLLRSYGGYARPLMRSLVLWAEGDRAAFFPPARGRDGTSVLVTGTEPLGSDLSRAASALSAALELAQSHGFYGVGVCQQGQARVSVNDDDLTLRLPGLAWEFERGPGCDPDLTAFQGFPPATKFDFVFTEEERAQFDLTEEARSRTDFTLSVRWQKDLPLVSARAHLRGQSSLKCVRKSYTLDLLGGEGRPFLPGLLSDELYLISMCLDDAYLNQLTANVLMAELGLFPFASRLVELTLDGSTRGLYLALQKPDDALEKSVGTLDSIIRRDIDSDNKPSTVDYSRGSAASALASYDLLLSRLDGLAGQALLDAVEAELDLDQFLLWLALMSLLQNGDYVDEIFFYATDSVLADGTPRGFYSILGWDSDDLFSNCHHQGRFAIVDPHQLLYCAEGLLEHRIFAEPLIYARYVDLLEQVMAQVTQPAFDSALDASLKQVLPYIEDDAQRAALAELLKKHPEAAEKEAAVKLIRDAAAQMKNLFSARAALLRERITLYRSATP